VKEYDHRTGEERQRQLFRGMAEGQALQFDADWGRNVQPHLPRHSRASAAGSAGGDFHRGKLGDFDGLDRRSRRSGNGAGGNGRRALGF
jgi:hypothetical protein